MAIARAGAAFEGTAFVQDACVYNHTIPVGANHIKIGIAQFSAEEFVLGVTVGGEAAVKEVHFNNGGSAQTSEYIYSLDNPPTGVVEIVVTFNGNRNAVVVSQAYSGVELVGGVPDAEGHAAPIGTSATASLTPVAEDCWVFVVAGCPDFPISAGANLVERGADVVSNIAGSICDSGAAVAGGVLFSGTVTTPGSAQTCIVGISFAPSAEPPPSPGGGGSGQTALGSMAGFLVQ